MGSEEGLKEEYRDLNVSQLITKAKEKGIATSVSSSDNIEKNTIYELEVEATGESLLAFTTDSKDDEGNYEFLMESSPQKLKKMSKSVLIDSNIIPKSTMKPTDLLIDKEIDKVDVSVYLTQNLKKELDVIPGEEVMVSLEYENRGNLVSGSWLIKYFFNGRVLNKSTLNYISRPAGVTCELKASEPDPLLNLGGSTGNYIVCSSTERIEANSPLHKIKFSMNAQQQITPSAFPPPSEAIMFVEGASNNGYLLSSSPLKKRE